MVATAYLLGLPLPAAGRGGDCRARDLAMGRNVHGPHEFAAPEDCQVNNGMLRLTVGPGGAAPSLAVDAWRGPVVVNDTYSDTYSDSYGGEVSTAAWFSLGTLTIDSPSGVAVLTGVQIERIAAHALTIRLVAPFMADAFVVLNRGWRTVRVFHGEEARGVTVRRRIRWTATPSPVGTAAPGRVEEATPIVHAMHRWVGSIDPVDVDAGAFSITTDPVDMARLGAGIGTRAPREYPAAQHAQLGDASRVVMT